MPPRPGAAATIRTGPAFATPPARADRGSRTNDTVELLSDDILPSYSRLDAVPSLRADQAHMLWLGTLWMPPLAYLGLVWVRF